MENYDSTNDTLKHIYRVREYLELIINELQERRIDHDRTKLEYPELPIFNTYTPKLKGSTYSSDEYIQYLKEMKVALDHHYKHNKHHPEYFDDGINDMTLIDLIEMLCDWIAASERHDNGDPIKSVDINQHRFKYNDQLNKIFKNTINFLKEHIDGNN